MNLVMWSVQAVAQPAEADKQHISLAIVEPGLTVRVGEGPPQPSPLWIGFPPGRYPIVVEQGESVVFSTTLVVSEGDQGVLSVGTLLPVILAPPEGSLVVPLPLSDEIVIDRRPVYTDGMPVLRHGAPVQIAPAVGQLLVESPNLFGEVLIDGHFVGYPPVRAELPLGPVLVEVRVEGVVRRAQKVEVQASGTHVVLR
jgi:hypothetical protein